MKLVVLVRTDLKALKSPGYLAACVAEATAQVAVNCLTIPPQVRTVILGVPSNARLQRLSKYAQRHIDVCVCQYVELNTSNGKPTPVCAAFVGPDDVINSITGNLRLY